ncbi:hypothetical protein KPH14_011334 [Odynerus spinipes]|uniref:WASH complex subunit 3 n=1 Tax=Odynerus spinipes TaxID=1348599 RepID=A0AAD9RJ61_9HYME|nr:hypothetical protein KPH14_011334 [Odynerus spinipes]
MNDYKMPIIEPTIDYTKVPPINQKRTISFINHFIVNTVTFLNKFALSCEEKLFEFENKLQRVEASLAILESRLSSIPDLEQNTHIQQDNTNDDTKENNEDQSESIEVSKIDEPDSVEEDKTINNEPETVPVERDPCYEKYFKMIHFGVPKEAVRLKIQQEGLDPTVLDEPQQVPPKPKPNAADTATSQGD